MLPRVCELARENLKWPAQNVDGRERDTCPPEFVWRGKTAKAS